VEGTPKNWEKPDWSSAGKVHDWRNYISEEVQGMWDTFPDDQKQALAQQANQIAGREDWD